MSMKFPYSGNSYIIHMDNGLKVKNSYSIDGKFITVEFINGENEGQLMRVPFNWVELEGDNYLISWQESDKNTVVHCDNFNKSISYAYYTTMSGEFYIMQGEII